MLEGTVAYFAPTKGNFTPEKAAHNFKAKRKKVALLWGDPVYVIKLYQNGKAMISAKGHHIKLKQTDLMDQPILSVYQIDCGQGDAALVHFPDDRWMMVDAGPNRGGSNSGKIAPDFLNWKTFVDQSWKNEFDLTEKTFRFDAVVCTHPDQDHFGGFMDMLPKIQGGVFEFKRVYHNGLGRFSGADTKYENGNGFGQLGPVEGNDLPEAWITTLLDDFADVDKYAAPAGNRTWHLSGNYADFLNELRALKGNGVGQLRRLHFGMGHLPDFGAANGPASVRILGPVQETWAGKPALRYLDTKGASVMGDPSRTRNGLSIVLRIDYKKVRIMLTGDLNFRSQALLLKHVPDSEFACHVAKACHHGAEDISWTFQQKMSPVAILFSSGDNETYAHPRALALGLAGACGNRLLKTGHHQFLGLKEKKLDGPRIYSTELSRSVELWPIHAVFDKHGTRVQKPQIQPRGRTAGTRGDKPAEDAKNWLLADDLVYGLINVRTDGERVVIATQKEQDNAGFHTEEFKL